MSPETESMINFLRFELATHGWQSGEIIFEFDQVRHPSNSYSDIIADFFKKHRIQSFPISFEVEEIIESRALESIQYGLSTKPNYTKVNKSFNASEQKALAYQFIQLFNKPRYYILNARIYQANLDLNDFWESAGAIAIDNDMIGIFWINDLYDMF